MMMSKCIRSVIYMYGKTNEVYIRINTYGPYAYGYGGTDQVFCSKLILLD